MAFTTRCRATARVAWPSWSDVYVRRILAAAAIAALCMPSILSAAQSDVADAAQRGDKAAVRALVQKKADINAAQLDGATALHWAVYNDDVELADLLIKAA